VRKAQIIADQGCSSCLPAYGLGLQQQRLQAFRRRVHSRGESGWTGAHHSEVVKTALGPRLHTQYCGDLFIWWVDQDPAIKDEHDQMITGR
jgi:hypothetical protein